VWIGWLAAGGRSAPDTARQGGREEHAQSKRRPSLGRSRTRQVQTEHARVNQLGVIAAEREMACSVTLAQPRAASMLYGCVLGQYVIDLNRREMGSTPFGTIETSRWMISERDRSMERVQSNGARVSTNESTQWAGRRPETETMRGFSDSSIAQAGWFEICWWRDTSARLHTAVTSGACAGHGS